MSSTLMLKTNKDKAEYRAFLKKIGGKIKARRLELELRQEDMDTEPFAFDTRDWQRIEYGDRNFTIQTLFKISKKLKIKPRDLLDSEIS